MPKRKVKTDFLDALESHYQAEIEKNLATLSLYLNNPIAVADHTNLMEDMKGLTTSLAEASDALEVLERYFEKDENDEV